MVSLPPIPVQQIEEFCRRWGVAEFALVGSVARGDARPDSDVDVMLAFEAGRGFTFENLPVIVEELRSLFGREVDVVERDRIRNPIRRRKMMAERKVIYGAAG